MDDGPVPAHAAAMTQTPSLGVRLAVIVAAHVVMLASFRWLLVRYEPDPSGLRLGTLSDLVLWAALTLAAPLIALASRSVVGLTVCAAVHAMSPLALLSTATDPGADLNFAVLLWWGPVPVAVCLVVALDRWVGRRPQTGQTSLGQE
jgi:hypothetical protein